MDRVQRNDPIFLGAIRWTNNQPGANRERWVALIGEHPNLVAPESRRFRNPFDKAKAWTTLPPSPDIARVVIGGSEAGSMYWSQDDLNEVSVFGEAQSVIPLAHVIAELIGGRFEPATLERTN